MLEKICRHVPYMYMALPTGIFFFKSLLKTFTEFMFGEVGIVDVSKTIAFDLSIGEQKNAQNHPHPYRINSFNIIGLQKILSLWIFF
jgi:hypothetical protein